MLAERQLRALDALLHQAIDPFAVSANQHGAGCNGTLSRTLHWLAAQQVPLVDQEHFLSWLEVNDVTCDCQLMANLFTLFNVDKCPGCLRQMEIAGRLDHWRSTHLSAGQFMTGDEAAWVLGMSQAAFTSLGLEPHLISNGTGKRWDFETIAALAGMILTPAAYENGHHPASLTFESLFRENISGWMSKEIIGQNQMVFRVQLNRLNDLLHHWIETLSPGEHAAGCTGTLSLAMNWLLTERIPPVAQDRFMDRLNLSGITCDCQLMFNLFHLFDVRPCPVCRQEVELADRQDHWRERHGAARQFVTASHASWLFGLSRAAFKTLKIEPAFRLEDSGARLWGVDTLGWLSPPAFMPTLAMTPEGWTV